MPSFFSTKAEPRVHLFLPQAFASVIVSPFIAVASAVKTVAGGIMAGIGSIKQASTGRESKLRSAGICYMKDGGLNFAYSTINTCTLGLSSLGYFLWKCYGNLDL